MRQEDGDTISSEVERITATSVPTVTTRPA